MSAISRIARSKTILRATYTFILKATKEVLRCLMKDKFKTIGMRVPSNSIALAMLAARCMNP
jgi:tRNA A37 threonylcarbamoyladenosine synthetase subunit TsaC/SUA5/YrdC